MTTLVFNTGETYRVETGTTLHEAVQRILNEENPRGETRTVLEIIDALGNAADRGDHEKSTYEILVNGKQVEPTHRLTQDRCDVTIRRQ